jgi:hypothetical protein
MGSFELKQVERNKADKDKGEMIEFFVLSYYLVSYFTCCFAIGHCTRIVCKQHIHYIRGLGSSEVRRGKWSSLVKIVIKLGSKCIALILVVVFCMGRIGKPVVFTFADEVSFI